MNGGGRWSSAEDMEQGLALIKVFVAKQLGPRPRRVADQGAAVDRACDVLDSLTTIEAQKARRTLAIEFLAFAFKPGRPTTNDWAAAIARVDGADEDEVVRMSHGGMSLRASAGGWDRPAAK